MLQVWESISRGLLIAWLAWFSLCAEQKELSVSMIRRKFLQQHATTDDACACTQTATEDCLYHRLKRLRLPGAPSIQINVPAIYPNALPPNNTPSSSPGTLSTNDTTKQSERKNFHAFNFHNPCLGLWFNETRSGMGRTFLSEKKSIKRPLQYFRK